MSDANSQSASLAPERVATLLGRAAVIAVLLLFMVGWLRAMGRPWVCPCGTVELWQGALTAEENSQQFSDWYSALHVIFGMALFGFVHAMKPHWATGAKLVVAVASSAAWEAMENTPVLIELFSNATNAVPYFGDSILNAIGDTLFVALGFLAAAKLPAWMTVLIALALEATIAFAIKDGFVIGTLRLFGVDI
ncbi:DUF2585 family protein [Aurantimonas endophytica]|uniref:Uncharacterized protein n=1 Tax=Aurantimonas endophytica TaxID=1522175 RepID=A0A7W6HCW0_9HYPH|nr:DUF2585 family protein [Aurantimonas endophytica]MBB4002905.1 hypothetical protein [Aurantimonas endophytica]MCO6403782.1 DUF2585 family protein [Aurantimonas endophytica]